MTPKTDTVIQFSGLKPGRYGYSFSLDGTFFEGFENEDLRSGKVDFEVILERRESMLLLNFAFHGVVDTICDRCLGDLEWPVEGEELLCVKFSDTNSSEDENVLFLPEGACQIDLAQWMYEYVAVRLPIQKVHPEGSCNPEMLKYLKAETELDADGAEEYSESGIGEGESDPRWDALKQLLNK